MVQEEENGSGRREWFRRKRIVQDQENGSGGRE